MPPIAEPGHEIRVPASVSNLGPAFDALSVAVQVYLHLRVEAVRPDATGALDVLFDTPAPPGENRIVTGFRRAEARAGRRVPGVQVRVRSDIPVRAGLGSSAAATVAGIRLYEALGGELVPDDRLAVATEVEGHPDNAAAALLGGLTLSCQLDTGRVMARAWSWPNDLRLVVGTPDAELETAVARKVLPASVPLRDAVFNLQRALLLVRAIETGRYGDLREALRDRWHQPARMPHVPGLSEALALDDPAALGVCLSGAGPSILVLAADRHEDAAARLGAIYRRLGLPYTIRTLSAHHASEE